MLGSMGLALPDRPRRRAGAAERPRVALEGDGSLLMQLGCLTTVAKLAPENLTIVVMGQRHLPDHRLAADRDGGHADMVAVARGCGIAKAAWAKDEADFEGLIEAA